MPKRREKVGSADPRQMSLLDLLQQAKHLRPEPEAQEGELNVQPALSHTMSRAIRASGLDRYEVAARMSRLLGWEVTKSMLDSWTAESKEQHRPPAEVLPAFCVVTGCREALQILTDAAGLFCLPGPDALRAEVQKLREDEQRIAAQRRKRELFLKEMAR